MTTQEARKDYPSWMGIICEECKRDFTDECDGRSSFQEMGYHTLCMDCFDHPHCDYCREKMMLDSDEPYCDAGCREKDVEKKKEEEERCVCYYNVVRCDDCEEKFLEKKEEEECMCERCGNKFDDPDGRYFWTGDKICGDCDAKYSVQKAFEKKRKEMEKKPDGRTKEGKALKLARMMMVT